MFQKTLEKAKRSGYTIIDATCPMVKEIHKIASKLENNGYRVIIIGDKLHDEILGITGQLKSKAIIIDKLENIPIARIKKIKRAGIIVQSIQNFDNVQKILNVLHKYIKQIKLYNTICNPARMKQKEVRSMPLENDLMIIIGSKTSANNKRIYELAKPLNKNSYWINSAKKYVKTG
ncbi:MAG: hypothetical protein PHC29_01140 [Candidatus Omnitrophica bacterium]|nr:hypothetical protein [Candidatus Omnitrophota bacterium]